MKLKRIPLEYAILGVAVVATIAVAYPAHAQTANESTADKVKRGNYLVTTSGCHDCHTPWKMGEKGPEPDMTRALSGHPEGMVLPPAPKPESPWIMTAAATNTAWAGPWGVSFTANLTPDPGDRSRQVDAAQLHRDDPHRPPHGPRPPDPAADADPRRTGTSRTPTSRRSSATCRRFRRSGTACRSRCRPRRRLRRSRSKGLTRASPGRGARTRGARPPGRAKSAHV